MRNSYLNLYSIGESLSTAMSYLKDGENINLSALERLMYAEQEWKEALKYSVSKFRSF